MARQKAGTATRARAALRSSQNWLELVKFCLVGATGYAVNLSVYVLMLDLAGLHYLGAAVASFGVAVTNNYWWNRHWTFRGRRGHLYYQGLRFLIVSLVALAANLAILRGLVALDVGKIVAQAIAIVLVMPFSFTANKLWSFRR